MSFDPASALLLIGLEGAQKIAESQAASRAAKAQARAYADEATRARDEAAFQEGELRRRNRQAQGRQRARYAKSGVGLEGSPLLAQEETAALGELDALSIRRAGDVRTAQALAAEAQARAQRRAALNSQFFTAGKTLLTGARKLDEHYPKLFS